MLNNSSLGPKITDMSVYIACFLMVYDPLKDFIGAQQQEQAHL